jgi:uncharacterized phage protein gp47/JayE
MLLVTRADLFSAGRQALAATPGIRLNPTVADIPGSDLNVVLGMMATLGEEVSSRGATALRGVFAELARGSQLDQVIYDRSGLLRFGAWPATVDLALIRPAPSSATPGTFSAGSLVQTGDGVQFALVQDAVFGDYDTEVDVEAQAVVAGAAGNVPNSNPTTGAGIVSFVTTPFDTTLTVQNGAPAAGGTDAESDISFLGRYRGYFATLARGTLGAIEYAALQVPGVAVATATEITDPTGGYPVAAISLVVGDLNGNATSSMLTAVSNSLLGYRAAGIPVYVTGGVVAYVSVAWSLAFAQGIDESLAISRVRAVTVAVAQFLPPGPANGILYRANLIAAAQQVPGVVIADSSLESPAGDVVPTSAQQMLRVLPTSVTFD